MYLFLINYYNFIYKNLNKKIYNSSVLKNILKKDDDVNWFILISDFLKYTCVYKTTSNL